MGKIWMKALFCVLMLNWQVAWAQTVIIDGSIQLDDQVTHSSIEVLFKRIAPAPIEETTTLTNSVGYFSKVLPAGIYEITYKKTGYFSVFLGQINCFNNLTLSSKTLFERSTLINVPYHFNSIQHAIDDSFTGDTILLQPLTYFENINTKGKKVLITSYFINSKSYYYIENTILDGGGAKSVVVCDNGETDKTILSGFTIRNGNAVGDYPDYFGGGIRCNNSSPTLENLIIEDNHAQYGGGGIFMMNSESTITNARIMNNTAGNDGGGIRITSSNPIIKNSIIARNTASVGGGITGNFFNWVGTIQITNSTIAYNTVTSSSENDFNGGAGIKITGAILSVTNSIIAFNEGDYGVSFYDQGLVDYPLLSYCSFFENGLGNLHQCDPLNGVMVTQNINHDPVDAFFNLFTNPEFTDSEKNDFSLTSTSQCVDAGSNSLIDLETDIDNFNRIYNDNNLSEARVNLGAIEAVSGTAPVFENAQLVVCLNDPVSFNITSEGEIFNWSLSEDDGGSLAQSGKTGTIDTLKSSIVLYVANVSLTHPSRKVPISFTIMEKPDFTIEQHPVNSISYQFSPSSTTGISTYHWTVNETILTSEMEDPIFEFPETGTYEICLLGSNPGCELLVCEEFDLVITALDDKTEGSEFDLYPNPVSNQLNIKRKDGGDFSFDILNSTGQLMSAQGSNSAYRISFNSFTSGTYFLVIRPSASNEQIKIFKIIKTAN